MTKSSGNVKADKEKSQLSAAEEREQKESDRLKDRALSQGLFGQEKADPKEVLKPSKLLLKCDGRDIIKKGQRRTKFLFSFPGLLAPVAGGRLGELTQLNTKNPILYIEYPLGRLKLFGTITYPPAKYLTLDIKRGQNSIVCEDSIEALLVFSEAVWVGSKEANPEELQLEMPPALTETVIHSSFSFEGGGGKRTTAEGSSAANEVVPPGRSEEEEAYPAEVNGSQRRRSGRTDGKQFKFREADSDESEEESSEGEGGDASEAMDGSDSREEGEDGEVGEEGEGGQTLREGTRGRGRGRGRGGGGGGEEGRVSKGNQGLWHQKGGMGAKAARREERRTRERNGREERQPGGSRG